MAGLSLVAGPGGLSGQKDKLTGNLISLNYLNKYKSQVILSDDKYFTGYNKFDEYPLTTSDTEKNLIIIEGRVYNKTHDILLKELNRLKTAYSDEALKEWLKSADGDFIIYILDKSGGDLLIFNDILGRLPVYYFVKDNTLYVSRYIKFILDAAGEVSFDRTAFGEYLLLGYLLGERTLFKDVKQLRPASAIKYDGMKVAVTTVHNYNFQNRIHAGKPFDEAVADLSGLLSESCVNRFNNNKRNILSLSGGLDSRTIGACMVKNRIPFETITLTYKNRHAEGEEVIARQVADYLDVEMQDIFMTPPLGSDLFTLLKLKEGMNYLATAPMLSFYRQVSEKFGENINLIFGDKSDKITLVFDNPTKKMSNLEELTDYIIGEHAFMDFAEVCRRLKIDEKDIKNDFYNLLSGYPEADFRQKYVHFRAIEKSHKLAFQGDDRHKRYFWNYSPLTSSPLVTYLFNLPDKYKKMHKIFIGLLNSYSPGIADIKYPNFKAPITSAKARLFMSSVYYLYPMMPHKLNAYFKAVFFGTNTLIKESSMYYKFLKKQYQNTPELEGYLDLSDLSHIRTHSLHNVMTLSSLVEYYKFHKSTFNDFLDEEFNYKN